VSGTPDALRDIVRRALDEDHAFDDITTQATVPKGAQGSARLIAKQDCVIAGLSVFEGCFVEVDPSSRVSRLANDGDHVQAGMTIARVGGSLHSILAAERTALNFLQRLSGIATMTAKFVQAAGRPVAIKDTRKTTPFLRDLEKDAVRLGGGVNHRRDLSDAVLIKDNHVAAAGGTREAIEAARASGKHVEVECDTLEQVKEALDTGVDEVLLDNMDVDMLERAVQMAKERNVRTEASGGVTLDTVRAIAATGVDSISVGALTHSAPAIDLSLEVEAI